MDELVLEGETYFSTKRAAKETGYAKDYVGQLCREGRVTARLVGRSWYVLASAIREHRFGGSQPEKTQASKGSKSEVLPVAVPSTREPPTLAWEPARYESVQDTPLPNINRLQQQSGPAVALKEEERAVESVSPVAATVPDMQSVWSEWFEKSPGESVHSDTSSVENEEPASAREQLSEPSALPAEADMDSYTEPDDESVAIPLRPVLEAPPPSVHTQSVAWEAEEHAEALAVANAREREEIRFSRAHTNSVMGATVLRTCALLMAILALVSVAVAAIGSGYFDHYLISLKQASVMSGLYIVQK